MTTASPNANQRPASKGPRPFNLASRSLNFDKLDFAVIPLKSGGEFGRALLRNGKLRFASERGEEAISVVADHKGALEIETYLLTFPATGRTKVLLLDICSANVKYAGMSVLDPPLFMRHQILQHVFTNCPFVDEQSRFEFSFPVVSYCSDQGSFNVALQFARTNGYDTALIRRVDVPYSDGEPRASMLCVIP